MDRRNQINDLSDTFWTISKYGCQVVWVPGLRPTAEPGMTRKKIGEPVMTKKVGQHGMVTKKLGSPRRGRKLGGPG